MQENSIPNIFGEEKYTNDQLKDLLRKAWEAEVAQKEKELGRSFSAEEKQKIKITGEFINHWHKTGLLPSLSAFQQRFGSIVYLANLLELPAAKNRPRETYYEGEKNDYIRILKSYVNEHNISTRTELRDAITNGNVPNVPASILKHIVNLFDILGTKKQQGKH